jgi:transcriptional antiterminator Rof (Rho-off)
MKMFKQLLLYILLTLCNGETIQASPDHIFYNDKQQYIVSQDIAEGSMLLNKDGEAVEVCNIAKKDTVAEVYDLMTYNEKSN